MKDLDKRLKENITVLTEEKENELISEWLSYDTKKNISGHVFTEELGELISAISKWERPGKSNAETWLNIAEELADVQIISKMIQKRHGINDELLAKIRTLKLTVPIPEDTPVEKGFFIRLTDTSSFPNETEENERTTDDQCSQCIDEVYYSYEGMMDVLKEFRNSVISTRGIFNAVIVDHETGELYTGREWNAMSVNERKDVFMSTLNYCEATILYERKLRGIAKVTPPSCVTTIQKEFEQQISDRVIEIIELIAGSNIDPYFWSFPKETLYATSKVYWATGIEFLANWKRCALKCVDEICTHPMLHENGRAFSVDNNDIFGNPLEVPIALYDIFTCLRMNNTAWLKNHNLSKYVEDIKNQLDSNPNMSARGTVRILDMICEDFPKINAIVREAKDPGAWNCKMVAILTYLNRL